MWCLFPWLGSYAFLAMERFLKLKCAKQLGISALDSSRPYFIQFKMKADKEEFFRVLKSEAEKDFDPPELVYQGEKPLFEKYDEFIPPQLVRKGFAYGILGIDEMKQRIYEWEQYSHNLRLSKAFCPLAEPMVDLRKQNSRPFGPLFFVLKP